MEDGTDAHRPCLRTGGRGRTAARTPTGGSRGRGRGGPSPGRNAITSYFSVQNGRPPKLGGAPKQGGPAAGAGQGSGFNGGAAGRSNCFKWCAMHARSPAWPSLCH